MLPSYPKYEKPLARRTLTSDFFISPRESRGEPEGHLYLNHTAGYMIVK
jgi:hypothetical protein